MDKKTKNWLSGVPQQQQKNSDYSFAKYINAKTKIEIRCKKHDVLYKQLPYSHKKGSTGCKECKHNKISNTLFKGKDYFIEVSIKKHGQRYLYDRVVYIDNNTKVEIGCKKHGYFWQTPYNHKMGKGCPKCAHKKVGDNNKKYDTESAIKKANKTHKNFYNYPDFIYHSYNKKSIVTCPLHGNFETYAGQHMHKGVGCPDCGKIKSDNAKKMTQEEFIEKANEAHNNKFNYPGEFKDVRTPIEIECKKHGIFKQVPNNHLSGAGCVKCIDNCSKQEKQVRDFIQGNGFDVDYSDRTLIKPQEIDIVVKNKKLAIEYDGIYYHSDKFKYKQYHLEKTERVIEKGYKLIHIFGDEWTEKEDIVKSRISNILGVNKNIVYGRKCEIKEVPTKEAMKFLEENHLQGKVGAKIKIGLYYDKELVSLMTFSGYRKNMGRNKKEGCYEMIRFCNKKYTTVIGSASKLIKYFKNTYKPKEILSYADRRWSEGKIYEKLGFKLEKHTPPNYFYTRGYDRQNRFNFRKSVLVEQGFDKNKTEKQIMSERGFYRIYDCGTSRYKLKTS